MRDVSPLVEPCINDLGPELERAHHVYFRWADREGGPVMGRLGWLDRLTNGSLDRCRAAVGSVVGTQPAQPEIDAAAMELVAAASVLIPLVNDGHDYYRRQDFRDDGLAHGRELHVSLVRAFDAFEAAEERLSSLVDELQTRSRASRLARLEGDPSRRGELLIESTMARARALLEMQATIRIEEGRLVTDRRDELVTTVEDLRREVDEMRANTRALFGGAAGVDRFVREADDFAVEAVRFMRRVRDAQVLTPGDVRNLERGACFSSDHGTPACVVDAYDDLVGAYNGL